MRNRARSHRAGIRAEYAAAAWLMLKGYWPVAMRYKTPVGEIDLIARRGKTLAVIEVKARARMADAAEAVHSKNQARVVRAAQYFLRAHPRYDSLQVRFDVCLIAWYNWPRHLPAAFS
ncbi:MAG: YraN family protein [Rickettsiales bacterium]